MLQASPAANPYCELFGSDADTAPMNHYDLIGAPLFEGDLLRIEAAARARLEQLKTPPEGLPVEVCRRIATEITAARTCLTEPESKRSYDLQLRRAMILSPQIRGQEERLGTPTWSRSSAEPNVLPEIARNGDEAQTRGSEANSGEPAFPPLPGRSGATKLSGTDEDDTDDAPGSDFHEHPNYEPVQLIARGRSSKVFEAFETTLRRKVAIKQLDDTANEQQTASFWQEAQFLAGQQHPAIIKIHGVDERRRWIIMELMNGNLEARISCGPLEPNLVRAILRQALEGLGYLHRQNKIHGEIKPANLLVDDDGYIRLNASPGFDANGEFRAPLGCQRHVAPELLNTRAFGKVGPAVDLYCLGFTMLELLVGPGIENLFKGIRGEGDQRDLAWLRWHNSHAETLPSLRHLIPDAPDDLVTVIDRLVAKDVAQRYQCVEEAQLALEDAPLLRVPIEGNGNGKDRIGRGPDAVIMGKPPAHREHAEEQERAKSLQYQLANSKYVAPFIRYFNTPLVRYAVLGCCLLLVLLLVVANMGPRARKVHVVTVPEGARISIDGEATEVLTPVTDMLLSVGSHKLTFSKDGYKSGFTIVTIPAQGDVEKIEFPLEKEQEKGIIDSTPVPQPTREYVTRISSIPPGAEVLIDVAEPGEGQPNSPQTPAQLYLLEGSHDLELLAEGYRPFKTTIRVTPDNVEFGPFQLKPITSIPPENDDDDDQPDKRKGTETPEVTVRKPNQNVNVQVKIPRIPTEPGSVTPDNPVSAHWRLPEYIEPARRREYFGHVRLLVGDSWMAARSIGTPIAREACARARKIYDGDPRLHFACAILHQKYLNVEAAKEQLQIAKQLELHHQLLFEQQRAKGIVLVGDPFPAPWRQLSRIYLLEKQWDKAIGECLDLIRYCRRTQQSHRPMAKPDMESSDAVLRENVRFVGHTFGYIKHQRPNEAHARVQPIDRFIAMVEGFLNKAFHRLFHDAIQEAWSYSQEILEYGPPYDPRFGEDNPILIAKYPEGRLSTSCGPLQDLLPSLEWERQLILDAVDNAIRQSTDSAIDQQRVHAAAKGRMRNTPLEEAS